MKDEGLVGQRRGQAPGRDRRSVILVLSLQLAKRAAVTGAPKGAAGEDAQGSCPWPTQPEGSTGPSQWRVPAMMGTPPQTSCVAAGCNRGHLLPFRFR